MTLIFEDWLQWLYPILERPSGTIVGGSSACRAGLQGGATTGRQVMKSFLFVATEVGERTSND
jgi:hypothetical protein